MSSINPSAVRSFDLVIFDCDGVLVDSEPLANRIFLEMLADIGLPMSPEEATKQFLGRTLVECGRIVGERLGRPAPVDLLEDFQSRLIASFETELRPIPGISQVLDILDQELAIPYCVASSGTHAKMRVSLGVTGLWPRLDGRVFSSTDVSRGKPFPDLFLHAARTLGAEPHRCAVIEDSSLGARGGVAAGMHVFGFAAATDPTLLREVGATPFFDMLELPNLLRSAW
jgi:HAD superfamily hydrolase (TIGR01509 family)